MTTRTQNDVRNFNEAINPVQYEVRRPECGGHGQMDQRFQPSDGDLHLRS